MYSFQVRKEAQKEFDKALKSGNKALHKLIDSIQERPYFKGYSLKGELTGLYKGIAPPYRIVFAVDEELKTVTIHGIDTRDDIYSVVTGRVLREQ